MRIQPHHLRRPLSLIGPIAAALWLISCGATEQGSPAPDAPARPNVLLISVDTLRADALSSYGSERSTTPFLDSLAAEGVRYERAYATSSWTTPSVVSMLTSSYPNRHRMGGRLRGVPQGWTTIPQSLPNLATRMSELGYRTYGLVANANLSADRGFDRGFDRYRCLGKADLDEFDEAFEPWIEEISGGEGPWFVWLHMLDPHGPYNGRLPWIAEYSADYERYRFMDGMASESLAASAPEMPPSQLAFVRALYDSEVAATDAYLETVFERLPGADEAFVLFTSDHGEEFLEHGGMLHGRTLYDESIRIPMIVRAADRELAGTVSEAAVSLVDVLPTLLAAVGDTPHGNAVGEDLLTQIEAPASSPRVVFAELLRGIVDRAAMDGRYKLILDESAGGEIRAELFDLHADPAERDELAEREPERVMRFEQQIDQFAATHLPLGETGETTITPEQLEALKALGYIAD